MYFLLLLLLLGLWGAFLTVSRLLHRNRRIQIIRTLIEGMGWDERLDWRSTGSDEMNVMGGA